MFAIRNMRKCSLLLHIFQRNSVNARWEQPWLIQPQSFPKQVSGWICFFFRWNISVICLTIVLKLTVTVFFNLYIQTLWPKWLNMFRSFQRRFGVWPQTTELNAFVCYVLVIKRMKLKTNLVFQIFLFVVYSFMDSYKDMNVNKFRIPTTQNFFKGGKCEAFKGVNL